MNVLLFQNENAFDLYSLPKDDGKSFVSAAVRGLDKNFVETSYTRILEKKECHFKTVNT